METKQDIKKKFQSDFESGFGIILFVMSVQNKLSSFKITRICKEPYPAYGCIYILWVGQKWTQAHHLFTTCFPHGSISAQLSLPWTPWIKRVLKWMPY